MYSGIGVDHAGDKGRQKDNKTFGGGADAEPDDRKRNPRNRGDRPDNLEDRIDQLVKDLGVSHDQPKRNADDDCGKIADQRQIEARNEVDRQDGAVGLWIVKFRDEALKDLRGSRQVFGVDQRSAYRDLPNQKADHNAGQ